MNKFSDQGLNSSLIIGTQNNLRLAYSHISNIQKFLNKYKKFNSEKATQLEIDERDEDVYSKDSIIPDVYLKTRTPIDRKKMYFSREDTRKRKSSRGKIRNERDTKIGLSSNRFYHSKYQSKYDKVNSQGCNESVYFPIVPLTMPSEISVTPKILKFEEISVEKLFSKNFSEDEDIEQSNNSMSKKFVLSSSKELIHPQNQQQDFNNGNSTQEKSGPIPSYDFSQVKPLTKEEFLMSDIFEKVWFLSFFHNGKFINYGPMNTSKIFLFLKNFYNPLPQSEKEKKNFMVVDSSSDIHFQPESLYEILFGEYKKKADLVVGKTDSQNQLSANFDLPTEDSHKDFKSFAPCVEKENLQSNFSPKTYPQKFNYQWKVVGKPDRKEQKKFVPYKQEVIGMRKADKTKVPYSSAYNY